MDIDFLPVISREGMRKNMYMFHSSGEEYNKDVEKEEKEEEHKEPASGSATDDSDRSYRDNNGENGGKEVNSSGKRCQGQSQLAEIWGEPRPGVCNTTTSRNNSRTFNKYGHTLYFCEPCEVKCPTTSSLPNDIKDRHKKGTTTETVCLNYIAR